MPHALYVCLQDEDKIASFVIDSETGRLIRQAEVAVPGGPSVLAISSDRRVLYLGQRTNPAISSFQIDQNTGALSPQGTSRRNTRRLFWRRTALAGICCRPITKESMRRCTRWERKAQSARHPSTGRLRRAALMPSRPTGPTVLPLYRTSPGSMTMCWSPHATIPDPT